MYNRRGRRKTVKPVSIKYQDWHRLVRRDVFKRDDFTCQDCGKRFKIDNPHNYTGRKGVEGLTLGHIIPRCLGGHFSVENLSAQCEDCNSKLGNQIWAKQLRQVLTNYTLK